MGEVDDGKACAALSYILVGVIWYFVDEKMRKNSFANYHAKQGLMLCIVWVILSIVVTILSPLLLFIAWLLWAVIEIALFILLILGIINAVNGQKKELPVIGGMANSIFKF